MPTGSSYVYQEIQDMLASYRYGIPVSRLETLYKEKFKKSLDYNSLRVETIEELLDKMFDEGMVLLYIDGESDESHVMSSRKVGRDEPSFFKCNISSEIQDMPTESSMIQDMPTESSDVYQEIQHIVTGYIDGISMSWVEKMYHEKFERSPDYDSLGVKDLKELLGKMRDKGRVLLYEKPEESKETYVMCAWYAESLRKFLKLHVQKLLDKHGGEIPLSCFEDMYKAEFIYKLNYNQFGLTGPDHLCEVLNLGLEEADSTGEKVIKA